MFKGTLLLAIIFAHTYALGSVYEECKNEWRKYCAQVKKWDWGSYGLYCMNEGETNKWCRAKQSLSDSAVKDSANAKAFREHQAVSDAGYGFWKIARTTWDAHNRDKRNYEAEQQRKTEEAARKAREEAERKAREEQERREREERERKEREERER